MALFYVNEIPFGKHLRMGLDASGPHQVIRGLDLIPNLWGRERE